MAPFNLSFWAPRASKYMWVFWSQEEGEGGGDPGRCVFKTSNQSFGLYGRGLKRRICEYRKHCTSLEFNILQDEEDNEDEFGSVIWRVFRCKKANYDVRGDFAHKCSIGRSYFMPLFKPSSRCCSGVLELVHTSIPSLFFDISYAVLGSGFKQSTEIEEINKALQGVRMTLQLTLAQIWIPCFTNTAMAYVDSTGERCHSLYLSCNNIFSSSISWNGDELFHYVMKDFNFRSKRCNFRKGVGIVGKALLYHKPCFCRNVTQLPEAVYPLYIY